MKPVVVDSTQCHLWTDALHALALAQEANSKWDRGTYVRFCVMTAWVALETSCQEALNDPSIGHSFKKNLDAALRKRGLPPITWGEGLWQNVTSVQETRKEFIHKYLALSELFPEASVAEHAVEVVREAIKSIYGIVGQKYPEWVDIYRVKGWEHTNEPSPACVAQAHLGTTFDDPNTRRIFLVIAEKEYLTSVFPLGHDTSSTVQQLFGSVKIPVQGIRVYEAGKLVEEHRIMMRGN